LFESNDKRLFKSLYERYRIYKRRCVDIGQLEKVIRKMLNGRKNKLRVKVVQVNRFSKYIFIIISSFNKQTIQNILLLKEI